MPGIATTSADVEKGAEPRSQICHRVGSDILTWDVNQEATGGVMPKGLDKLMIAYHLIQHDVAEFDAQVRGESDRLYGVCGRLHSDPSLTNIVNG
jgi:hypothetical protein